MQLKILNFLFGLNGDSVLVELLLLQMNLFLCPDDTKNFPGIIT